MVSPSAMAAYRMDKEGSGCSNAAVIHLQDSTLNNHAAISFTVSQGTNNLVGQRPITPNAHGSPAHN